MQGNNRPIKNMRESFLNTFTFQDDDIYNLLGPKQYDKFNAGQYVFNVTKKHLDLICGNRPAMNKDELLMYSD
jgi:hypothetical protein